MKKTYIAPLTEVVKLNVGEMLQAVSNYEVKGKSIDGSEGGFIKADKADEDYDSDLW